MQESTRKYRNKYFDLEFKKLFLTVVTAGHLTVQPDVLALSFALQGYAGSPASWP